MPAPNPFYSHRNYARLLAKIALITSGVATFCVWLMRTGLPAVDGLLAPLDVAVGTWVLPIGTLAMGIAIGVGFRAVTFSRRLSSMFSIRHRIDCNEILIPMALMATHGLTPKQVDSIRAQRGDLIYQVFYRYTGGEHRGTGDSRDLIESGLRQLFIYWVLLEAVVLLVATAILLIGGGHYAWACALLLAAIAGLVGVRLNSYSSARRSWEEVETILADPVRKREVAAVFEAL